MQDLPILEQGSSGSAVAVLQRLLVLYGYQNVLGAVDGDFGAKTASAVTQFQRDQNLKLKDGIVGPETWRTLAYPAGTLAPTA